MLITYLSIHAAPSEGPVALGNLQSLDFGPALGEDTFILPSLRGTTFKLK